MAVQKQGSPLALTGPVGFHHELDVDHADAPRAAFRRREKRLDVFGRGIALHRAAPRHRDGPCGVGHAAGLFQRCALGEQRRRRFRRSNRQHLSGQSPRPLAGVIVPLAIATTAAPSAPRLTATISAFDLQQPLHGGLLAETGIKKPRSLVLGIRHAALLHDLLQAPPGRRVAHQFGPRIGIAGESCRRRPPHGARLS